MIDWLSSLISRETKYIYIYIQSIYIMWTKGYVIKQSLKLRTVDLWTYICFVTNHYWWQWLFVGLNVQLYSWQDQVTSIILVTLTRVPDYDRKFRLTRDKGPIHRDISPCNEPAKTTPTCYCYKLCFTYTKMWHLSVLSFSTLLPPMWLKTCYEQNMS